MLLPAGGPSVNPPTNGSTTPNDEEVLAEAMQRTEVGTKTVIQQAIQQVATGEAAGPMLAWLGWLVMFLVA